MSDAAMIMVTTARVLTEEERENLRSGTTYRENFRLGLYAPQFSSERDEKELELFFRQNK